MPTKKVIACLLLTLLATGSICNQITLERGTYNLKADIFTVETGNLDIQQAFANTVVFG